MQLSHIGDYKIRLRSVDSTNHYAASLFTLGKPAEGTVVLSEYQEKGKGQMNAAWESEKGLNLLASFILYPGIDISDFFLLNQAITLAVRETLTAFLPECPVTVKWPNDIMVYNKKAGGILIENNIRGNQFVYSIVGIGINVNQRSFDQYVPPATSIVLETGSDHELEHVLETLCGSMNAWYTRLKAGETAAIREAYRKVLFDLGRKRVFKVQKTSRSVTASIEGVRDDGKLILRHKDGKTSYSSFKEVSFVF